MEPGPCALLKPRSVSAFIALDLDDAARALAAALIEQHRATVPARWLRSDKLHITLEFLGNPADPSAFAPKVDALAAQASPFSLSLHGAGVFVTERAPAVLWLGIAGDLAALHALHGRATPGDRPFTPHLTLGRAHTPNAFDALAASLGTLTSAPFEVSHLTLYESTHHAFRVVHRAPLQPASVK